MACQVVHYPHHSQLVTQQAPEPRDVVWSKVHMSLREKTIRNFVVGGLFALLALFWTGKSNRRVHVLITSARWSTRIALVVRGDSGQGTLAGSYHIDVTEDRRHCPKHRPLSCRHHLQRSLAVLARV